MSEETLREELYAANENRAVVYWLIFDELRREFGEDKAAEVVKRAIYRRGEMLGEKFKRFAPDDLRGLCEAFVAGVPDEGRMFAPTVLECTDDEFTVEFRACPLKTAWQKLGLSEAECATICEVAGIVDAGMFEGAGFDFSVRALPQGETERCLLTVKKKK